VEQKDGSLAREMPLGPATGLPELPGRRKGQHRFEIAVVFTSMDATVAALKMAGALATGLSAYITLIVPQVVPYPLPLGSPPVSREFSEQKFREIASESPVDTAVLLYLCRDRLATLDAVLKRGSIVVIGARRRWWRAPEKNLARKLRRSGHDVILSEMT
jgi:hypothetical protein